MEYRTLYLILQDHDYKKGGSFVVASFANFNDADDFVKRKDAQALLVYPFNLDNRDKEPAPVPGSYYRA
jgi:hypothetical protein